MTRQQLLASGVSRSALAHAVQRGRWRRVCPAVYVLHSGAVTTEQRYVAALLHAGPGAALDAATACRLFGLRVAAVTHVHVVVPHARRPADVPWLIARRARFLPPVVRVGGLPVVALPHAVVATCARSGDLRDVRALIADAVQRRRVDVAGLRAAISATPPRHTALLRSVLDEVEVGARSAPEAEFFVLVRRAGLPEPLLNCRLFIGATWLADPDAYWPEAALVHETDSRDWHLLPDSWERTMRRHAQMTAAGLLVMHSSPSRIRTDGPALVRQLARAYAIGRARGAAPNVRAEPS